MVQNIKLNSGGIMKKILAFAVILMVTFSMSFAGTIANVSTAAEFNKSAKVMYDNKQTFPDVSFDSEGAYSDEQSVFTYRGGNFRNNNHSGFVTEGIAKITAAFSKNTGGGSTWGGGSGWTGQPVILQWNEEEIKRLNLNKAYAGVTKLTEVIQGSLNGNVYFYDFYTGKETRPNIKFGNVIKGSVSVHPNKKLLFVGAGVQEQKWFGMKFYDLETQKEVYYLNGLDAYKYRGWGAFDANPLVDEETDSLFLGGENGVIYFMKLNGSYTGTTTIKPTVTKMRYQPAGVKTTKLGVENSIAGEGGNIFFADNSGRIMSYNVANMEFNWVFYNSKLCDDTNATLVLSKENGETFIYLGNESDIRKSASNTNCTMMKIKASTGELVWSRDFKVTTTHSNGGIYGTPAIGKDNVYVTVSNTSSKATTFALSKSTGADVWKFALPTFAWSSPHLMKTVTGTEYIAQGDGSGNVFLLSEAGKELSKVKLNGNIEMSPAGLNDNIIYGTRAGTFYNLKLSVK